MAEKVLHATDEKANFQRLARLLVCGGITLLREVFDCIHPPANLAATLTNPTTKAHLQRLRDHKKVITQLEWKCLYPSPGMCGKSTDFDITLLFKLFRNTCGLAPPVTGWDNVPNTTDHSREADLARIKFYRNRVCHSNDREISDVEFLQLWREISEALLRIARSISSAKKDEWEKVINKFLSEPLTPDADQSITELKSWYKKDMDTKDEIEKLTNAMKEMKIKEEQRNITLMEQMRIMQDQLNQRNIELQEQLNIKLQEQSNTMLDQMINIVIRPESYKPGGSSSISPGHLPSDPQLQEAGVQPQRECVIPIPMEQPQAEGATGQSTGELQTNQQNPPANLDFWYVLYSFKEPIILLLRYLRIKLGVDVQDNRLGSLVITVSCSSLEVLEQLWGDYCSDHLSEVVQETLVTEQLLKELCLSEVKLKTIISEKEYSACKEWFMQRSGKTKRTSNCYTHGRGTY